jgi:pyruvate/2-oxoglutarate/acetoin dehydrogenase E1 component
MNIKPFLDSVKETNKLIVIEEGNNSGGFGESLVSSLSGKSIDFETLFIGSNNIIPSTVEAESSILPSSDSILKSILEFLNK